MLKSQTKIILSSIAMLIVIPIGSYLLLRENSTSKTSLIVWCTASPFIYLLLGNILARVVIPMFWIEPMDMSKISTRSYLELQKQLSWLEHVITLSMILAGAMTLLIPIVFQKIVF